MYLAREVVWASSTVQATLHTISYFESYWVGTIGNGHKYKTSPDLSGEIHDLKANSYFVASFIEDSATNCLVSDTSKQDINISQPNCSVLAES